MAHKRLFLGWAAVAAVAAFAVVGTHLRGVSRAEVPTLAQSKVPWVHDGITDRRLVPAWMPVYGQGGVTRGWVRGSGAFSTDDRHITIYKYPASNAVPVGKLDQ